MKITKLTLFILNYQTQQLKAIVYWKEKEIIVDPDLAWCTVARLGYCTQESEPGFDSPPYHLENCAIRRVA